MSKSARDTLFGITLSELIIILFFIMLLLAISKIKDLTDQIPKDTDDVVPASTIEEVLFPEGEIKTDLIPIDFIINEIRKLQKERDEFNKLKDALAQQDKEKEKEGKGDEMGTGDCREGGFWITTKCSDHCWAIENQDSARQYDYLLDIGVCENFVVVQRSEWIQKTELDFSQVEGAYEMVSQEQITRGELYDLLDTLKEPGYQLEPKQCFHSVRLIDLGSRSIDAWETTNKQVNSRVSPFVLTKANGNIYNSVRTRFKDDICNTNPKDVREERKLENAESILSKADELVNEQALRNIEQRESSLATIQADREPVLTKALMDVEDFNNNFIKNRKCKSIRSNRVTFNFEITVGISGTTYQVKYLGNSETLSRGEKRLLEVTQEALLQTSYIPATNDGIEIQSVIRQPITLPKGVCQ